MPNTKKTNKKQIQSLMTGLLSISSLISLCLWTYMRYKGHSGDTVGNYFALSLSITPFLAGCFGFEVAKHWGHTKSLLGKAIISLSTGLLLWAAGNLVWAYYNIIKHVSAPYPSWADVGYGLGVLFWILCTVYLGRALGVATLMRNRPRLKWLAAGFALASVVLSYVLFIVVARNGDLGFQTTERLKAFFDIYYPLTDVCSLLVILSVVVVAGKYIGGLLRLPVVTILVGMFSSYIYDLTFSYSTTKGTYVNGQFSDIFLIIATVALSFAIVVFGERALSSKHSPKVGQGGY